MFSTARNRLPGQLGVFGLVFALGDVLIVIAAGVAAAALVDVFRPQLHLWPFQDEYRIVVALGALLLPGVLNWFGVYRSWRGLSHWSEQRQVVLGMLAMALMLAALALATKSGADYSRSWMGCWFLLAVMGLCLSRTVKRSTIRLLRHRGFDRESVVLVGGGPMARRVMEHLRQNPGSGFRVVGYIAAGPEEASGGVAPCLGMLDDIKTVLEGSDMQIDQLWIVLPLSADQQIREMLHALRHSTVDIRLIPDFFSYQLLNYSTEHIAGLPVLNLSYSPLSGPNRYAKELLDRFLALDILLAVSPLMLLIALCIKLTSPGPVLFRQVRHGWDGRPFTVYKFRTMHVRQSGKGGYKGGYYKGGYEQARRNDPRVTRFGQFLRQSSLDELPQFINVLQGTMSIVGPRPHPIELNHLFRDQVERYMWRHKVKPGITGWAQVNGYRGETDTLDKMRKRVEYDLYYIEHWSLWFDIQIILMTVWRGFRDRNAY